MIRNTRLILCFTMLGLLAACGGSGGPAPKPPYAGIKIGRPYEIYGRWYKPEYDAQYDETGVASWYGPGFHGGHTANGERFDQYAMTAAHKTLPLPCVVRVTNLDNGKTALVKVNDRGPFAHNRIIDLSKAAAKKLDVIRSGTAHVRVQFLEKETREYVQNMQSGTQYAMNAMNRIDPSEAGEREEAGAKPKFAVETKIAADDAVAPALAAYHRPAVQPVLAKAQEPDEFTAADVDDEVVSSDDLHRPKVTPATYETPVLPPSQPQISSPDNTGYFIHAGTFNTMDNAQLLVNRISDVDGPQIMPVSLNGRKMYRVMIGPYSDRLAAKNMLSKLASIGIPDAKMIHN